MVSPFVFRYEDDPPERALSPALTGTTENEPSPPSTQGTVPLDHLAVTIIQAKGVDILGIALVNLRWVLGMLSFFTPQSSISLL